MTQEDIAETKPACLPGIEETTHSSRNEAYERYCLLIEQGFLPAIFEGHNEVFHVCLLPDTQP